ncbi:hypothetical protein A6A27_24715 [Micromonospora sp. CB01531]|nr:hypothetical protein A6A27_24715 [Micromonospora sp. CB01531]
MRCDGAGLRPSTSTSSESKWLVTGAQCLAGKVDAPAQMLADLLREGAWVVGFLYVSTTALWYTIRV